MLCLLGHINNRNFLFILLWGIASMLWIIFDVKSKQALNQMAGVWCTGRRHTEDNKLVDVRGLHSAVHRIWSVDDRPGEGGQEQEESMDLLQAIGGWSLAGELSLLFLHRFRHMGHWAPYQWRFPRPAIAADPHYLVCRLLHNGLRSRYSPFANKLNLHFQFDSAVKDYL